MELGAVALEQRGSADRHTPLVALEAVKCVSSVFLREPKLLEYAIISNP